MPSHPLCTQTCIQVDEKTAGVLQEKVDAVVCVAGGWAGGNSAHKGTAHVIVNVSTYQQWVEMCYVPASTPQNIDS